MFGNLFTADKNVDCDLPEKRDATGLCGIKNQGATCYLNSLLQTLFFTPEFRKRLFALNKEELGFQHYKLETEVQNKVRKIPLQLQLLFARLLHIDQNACDTENLTKSFGWVDKEHFQQHDVQELSRILFDAINDSLRGTSDQNLVNDLYKGTLKNRIVCDTCKNETVNMEDFLDLTIAVSNRRNISSSLKDMYVSEELMTDKNKYHCSKCSCLRDAKKDSKIKVLPDILTFSLLRFNFDYTTLKRYKENGEFIFPLCLNMAPYVVESKETELNEYELYSVIIHKGNAFGGHYHAYIRDYDGLGTVPDKYSFHQTTKNDHTPTHSGDASSSAAVTNPSEVIAYIVAKLGGEDVPLLKISESIMQECGTSWNKQYRKNYGTMLKYIQSQPELFVYNKKSQSVTLKSFEGVLLDNKKFAENCFSEEPHACNNEVNDSVSKTPDEKVIWFDFNDSKIQPITMAEIEKQYQGRESAYMLFYRRKKLGKSDETSDNKNYCPSHLKEIIDDENTAMEQYRIERELKKNHININLYVSDMFKQSEGLVVLKEENIEPIVISFSKDSKTAELKKKIQETLTQHHSSSRTSDEEDIFVSELQFLSHKGIHIYESLEIDKNVTIKESKFFNNIKAIVWNRKEISDINIEPGEEYEPVVISVQCTNPNNSTTLMCNCVVSSHLSINDVHKKIGQFSQLDVTDLNASILNVKQELRTVGENEVSKSIAKVLQESETLCLSMEIPSIPNVDDEDGPTLDISVEPNPDLMQKICNLFNATSDHMALTRVFVKANVCKSISVETLKIHMLCLFDPLKTFPQLSLMASVEDDVLLPLLETDLVCNILNKISFDKIMVSQCKGLVDNEICTFVYASKGQNSKIRGNFKMKLGKKCVLNKQTTVAKNIKAIVSAMDLDKSKTYHLRHITNDKQSGDVIEEADCSLSKVQIEHGCRLLICEGPAISTGFVQIPVWRYPQYPLLNDLQHEIFDLDVTGGVSYENPSFVEYVRINKEDTLYDLKETLSKLDGFKGYEVEEICVRNVYKRLCMKTFTSSTMTIKRLKFGPLTPIAVQRRNDSSTSNIKDNTIILNVFFHLPSTRHYFLQHELLWENAQDMASLPACIADMLGNKEITVARYSDDENEWKVLPLIESSSKKNNNPKRNKSKKNSHLKNKGRNNSASNKKVQSELNEGDIIGVKINERENFDKIAMNDFDREEDITARNLKKNCEPTAITQAIEKPVQKESEASLKIHVDKFE